MTIEGNMATEMGAEAGEDEEEEADGVAFMMTAGTVQSARLEPGTSCASPAKE